MSGPADQGTGASGAASPGDPISVLRDAFTEVSFAEGAGPSEHVATVGADDLEEFVAAARNAGFVLFVDLCGVDYLRRSPRFDVVVTLLCTDPPQRLRIKVGVPGSDPIVPSITGIFPGANFYERETFDLFGIEFEGHPDLTRILLPDDWEGHPLRKDYGVGSVPVQFKGAHKAT